MKLFWMSFLISLSLCTCKSDKPIIPQEYDGKYPYLKSNGMQIQTHQSTFTSSWIGPPVATPVLAAGQYSLMFKNHDWNHWSYMNVSFRKGSSKSTGYENLGDQILGVNFAAQSEYHCTMETVSFVIPAQSGRYRFGQEVGYSSVNPSFYIEDCDEPKGLNVVDSAAQNWVNITKLDILNKQVEGSFDLSFRVAHKDTSYSIVYPTSIRIRGSFKGPITLR